MKITFIGHAGIFIETRHASVLCDPWFNPAYFASWFPFPSNEELDSKKFSSPTYLYVSHLHLDHFDARFLKEHVSKEATVLLPDYPLNLLERALRNCGFTKFVHTKNGQLEDLNGLKIMIMAMTAPIDGPLGDSGILIDDGETRIFNQNDSRPIDIDLLNSYGPYDAHFLQFSGAIWYPMVYQYPEKMLEALGRKKRENELARALRYVRELNASFVIPSAGPPCFLDDHLFSFNDFERSPSNTFPDQTVFLEFMQKNGLANGRLMIPGSIATLSRSTCDVTHPLPENEVQAIFTQKRAYLEAYQARQRPAIEAEKASWPRGQVNILQSLQEWIEPLMEKADLTSVGINGRILIDCDIQQIVLDFHLRKIYAWDGDDEQWDYRFHIDHALLEYCIVNHVEDWINLVFLSCRFEAKRRGAYNEYVYCFFKCLSPERLQYAEDYYASRTAVDQTWESHGYTIQKYCPHQKADLTRFGRIENGILTCTMHGWQFELETGRCLTSEGHRLYTKPLNAGEPSTAETVTASSEVGEAGKQKHAHESGASVRLKCDHCWYRPSDLVSSQSTTSQPDLVPSGPSSSDD